MAESLVQRAFRKANRVLARGRMVVRPPARAAIIGCGRIFDRHSAGYDEAGIARLVGVSDVSLRALAHVLGSDGAVRGYLDYQQMLRDVRPDVVSVCTWPQSRREIVLAAAESGVRGILCEKPLALRMDDIEAMQAACDRRGVKLACGHQFRFHPVFCRAASMLASNEVGEIEEIRGRIRGSLANNGPHLVDTVRFLLGDPPVTRVRSELVRTSGQVERGLPCEDAGVTEVEFANGVRARLATGDAQEQAFEVIVRGTRGELVVAPEVLTVNGTTVMRGGKDASHAGRRRQFREFVRWAIGKQPAYSASGASSAASAEVVLAGYASVGRGDWVQLPLDERGDIIGELYGEARADAPAPVRLTPGGSGENRQLRLACQGGGRAVKSWFVNRPAIGLREFANVSRVLASGQLNRNGGQYVRRLEAEFARMYGARAAVTSTSGTAAIHVALGTVNPDPCDEVIVTPLTDIGSVIPILQCNCVPVFADVDPMTGNLTAESIAARITARTRAVIVVHLFGHPADLGPIRDLLAGRNIALIEDCAQAHLARYRGQLVGTIGDFGCFSFQQSKQISCGDGGITLVNRDEDVERARLFIDKGWVRGQGERHHAFLGMNYRMTELQAAVALAQLTKAEPLINARRRAADELLRGLKQLPGVIVPAVNEGDECSWWKIPVGWEVDETGLSVDDVFELLSCEGVKAARTYLPRPLFEEEMLRCGRTYGTSRFPYSQSEALSPDRRDFPGLEEFNRRWILLPWSSTVRRRHIRSIVSAFRKLSYLRSNRETDSGARTAPPGLDRTMQAASLSR